MLSYQKKKMNVVAYLLVLAIIIALIVVLFIIFKYNVEGESIPAFKVSNMIVVSTAQTEEVQLEEDEYSAKVIQNNDIRIAIEKNKEYKKEAIIRKITINNIQIEAGETPGSIEIYRPSSGDKLYEYTDKYKVKNKLEYIGAQETYFKGEELQIANQGGIIDLSIILNDLGTIKYNKNELLKVDGTLLKELGIEKIDYKVKFDLIIEQESGVKLKTKIELNLPAGNILENGIETIEETNMKTVFKRI